MAIFNSFLYVYQRLSGLFQWIHLSLDSDQLVSGGDPTNPNFHGAGSQTIELYH